MKEKKWLYYLLIIVVGILVSIPCLWVQVKTSDDGFIHLTRLIGLDKSVLNGEFPFLVFPHICRDFGYSMTAFYPPIVTYVPYIFGLLIGGFAGGLKIFASLTIVLSGIFMYNFVNEVTKNKIISFISAIVYMIFPYHFEQIYNRFAIGEFTALVFVPIVFQGLYNLLNGDKKKHFYIAIGAIGLILSHTISTVYTALFCIIYIAFNVKNFFKKEVIIKCVINLIFILLISSLFIIPMLEFKMASDYAIFRPEVMKTSGEYTYKKGIELWQLIKDKNEKNGVSFIIGVPMIFMLAITLLVHKDIEKKYQDFYLIEWILGIICVFMCTNYFPWYYMPNILNTIQYPWRMLGFAIFFLAPVCAINVYYLINWAKKESVRKILYSIFFIMLAVFTTMRLSIYKAEDKNLDFNYESELKENLVISHLSVNRDYLPYKALITQFEYFRVRENRTYILEGNAIIQDETKDGFNYKCKIYDAQKDSILELPYVFYPGYTITLKINEEKNYLDYFESNNGFASIKIPKDIEEGEIFFEYTGTTIEKVSYIISGISLIAFVIYIISLKTKRVRLKEKNEKEN